MALLDVKTRQKYLKELGFYTGSIDGSVGPLTKKAYKDLQNKYFTRKQDLDGLYGPNTDVLLRNAYSLKDIKNFKLNEFRCGCKAKYCTGYPAIIDKNLIDNLQKMRDTYNKSITITSGLRCGTHNAKIGGVAGSSHTKGKAVDIYMNGKSNTHGGRVELVNYWDTLPNARYAYCNNYMKYVNQNPFVYKSSTMGNATHLNVK